MAQLLLFVKYFYFAPVFRVLTVNQAHRMCLICSLFPSYEVPAYLLGHLLIFYRICITPG